MAIRRMNRQLSCERRARLYIYRLDPETMQLSDSRLDRICGFYSWTFL